MVSILESTKDPKYNLYEALQTKDADDFHRF